MALKTISYALMKKYKVEKVKPIFSWNSQNRKSLELSMEDKINEMANKGYEVQSFELDANYGGAYIIFVKN